MPKRLKTHNQLFDEKWELSPEPHPLLGTHCWLWTAYLDDDGYGEATHHAYTTRKAHRVSYQRFRGPIPRGLQLDHLCRVRHCVNPQHLEAVTCGENIRRGETGSNNRRKTHCLRGHPFAGDNLYVTPLGRRHCRACKRVHLRDWNLRNPGRKNELAVAYRRRRALAATA